jgi:hypothetical protein
LSPFSHSFFLSYFSCSLFTIFFFLLSVYFPYFSLVLSSPAVPLFSLVRIQHLDMTSASCCLKVVAEDIFPLQNRGHVLFICAKACNEIRSDA